MTQAKHTPLQITDITVDTSDAVAFVKWFEEKDSYPYSSNHPLDKMYRAAKGAIAKAEGGAS